MVDAFAKVSSKDINHLADASTNPKNDRPPISTNAKEVQFGDYLHKIFNLKRNENLNIFFF